MVKKFSEIIIETNEYNKLINEEFTIPKFVKDYKETGTLIKDKVYENLQIAKDQINDPENIQKLNDFLDKVEETTTNVSNIMKNDRNLKIIENLLNVGKWGSIVTSVYQLIFNTTLSFTHFSLGGIGAIKIALFLYILNLIVSTFRKYNTFVSLIREVKNFIINIINAIKKPNSSNVSESYVLCLKEYGII